MIQKQRQILRGNMRLTKIKIKKTVLIGYQYQTNTGDWDVYSLESEDQPKDALIQVFSSFKSEIIEICNLQNSEDEIILHEINLVYPKNTLHASFKCSALLTHLKTWWDFTTPKLPLPVFDDFGKKKFSECLTENCVHFLDLLETECKDYIKGIRKQLKLEFGREEMAELEESAKKITDLLDKENMSVEMNVKQVQA